MDFTDKSNKSLAFKKFTNNRYNVETFEKSENPDDIDRITTCLCTPGLTYDELLGLIYCGYPSTMNGVKMYPKMLCTAAAPLIYDETIIDGAYVIGSAAQLDFKTLYESQYNWAYTIYIIGSGRIITLSKTVPWQTIVDYLDSLNGGE